MDIVLRERRGAVGLITLNEPERLNPLSAHPGGSEDQLVQALLEMERDSAIRAVVITGAGRAFCAGADRKSLMAPSGYSIDERVARAVREPTADLDEATSWALWVTFERYSKPVIAAVNGFAIAGGWDLALHCDIIIADETARFKFSFVELGLMAGSGTLLATRAAGSYQAADVLLTARWVEAREAKEMGLVSRVVAAGTCLEEALKAAEQIAAHPPLAVSVQKAAIQRSVAHQGEWRLNQRDFVLLGLTEAGKEARARSAETYRGRGSRAE